MDDQGWKGEEEGWEGSKVVFSPHDVLVFNHHTRIACSISLACIGMLRLSKSLSPTLGRCRKLYYMPTQDFSEHDISMDFVMGVPTGSQSHTDCIWRLGLTQ